MLKHGHPATTAVVLAAGESKRMPDRNKLLDPVDGVTMIKRVVGTIVDAGLSDIVVVTGHEPDRIRGALSDYDVRFVHNSRYKDGMSASLRTGLAAVGGGSDSALIFLGDMPWIKEDTIRALLHAFDSEHPRICVPIYNSTRGHPVLWPARYFPEIAQISGDRGARKLLDEKAGEVTRISVFDAGVTLDIDTSDTSDTS